MAGVEEAGTDAVARERIVVRSSESDSELMACVELQKEVWGFSDAELVPLRLFMVAQKIGGQVLGAFEGHQLVGFALGIPVASAVYWMTAGPCRAICWGGSSSARP